MTTGSQVSELYTRVQEHAASHPESTALLHHTPGKAWITKYAELAEDADRFAALFAATTPANAIIPMFLSKSAPCVAAMIGALGAGRAFACLNKKLRVPQLSAVVSQTRAGAVLIDGPGVMVLGSAAGIEPPLMESEWWLIRASSWLPAHAKTAAALREKGWRVGDLPLAQKASSTMATSAAQGGAQIGCCLFTSGSTGTPKGVLISSRDLDERARAEVDFYGLDRNDVLLSLLPFSFDVGLNQLLSALAVGCSLVLLDSWLPADIRTAAAKYGVTGISGVPSIWQDMIRADMGFDTEEEHASLRFITVSGGDLLPHQLERLPSLVPGRGIFKTYGQTEAFRPTALRPEDYASRKRSVGRPFGGARVYVVRDGRSCAPGEVGEIVHTGLGTMSGYLDGEDRGGKLRSNPFRSAEDDAAVAVFTGDLGYRDEEGYFFLSGRRDAMLKIEGNRVYPQEVAAHLTRLASLAEAQVVGIVDEAAKTRLVAFIVWGEGPHMDSPDLRRSLLQHLPSYMVPGEIVVLSSIPRTASGKPDLPALKAEAERLFDTGERR